MTDTNADAGIALRDSANLDAFARLPRVRGGTLGGTPSWAAVSSNSAVEVDVANTTISGGEVIYRGYAVGGGVNTGSQKALDFRSLGITDQTLILALDHAGQNPIGLSIVCTGIGGTANCAGALTWTEVR